MRSISNKENKIEDYTVHYDMTDEKSKKFKKAFSDYYSKIILVELEELNANLVVLEERYEENQKRLETNSELEFNYRTDRSRFIRFCNAIGEFCTFFGFKKPPLVTEVSLRYADERRRVEKIEKINIYDPFNDEAEMNFYTVFNEQLIDLCDDADFDENEEEVEEEIKNGSVKTILNRIMMANSAAENEIFIKEMLSLEMKPKDKRNIIKRIKKAIKKEPANFKNVCRFLAYIFTKSKKIVNAITSFSMQHFRELLTLNNRRIQQNREEMAKFLAELVKFKLLSKVDIFEILTKLVENYLSINIQVLCVFLENCGRFLLLEEDMTDKIDNFLKRLRNKALSTFTSDEKLMMRVNNTILICKPESVKISKKVKELTVEEEFLVFIFDHIKKELTPEVAVILRKFDWGLMERKIFKFTYKFLTEGKMDNIQITVQLLNELSPYHPQLITNIVNLLFEEVRISLEKNDFNNNQRVTLVCTIIATFFKYRLIKTKVIIELVYFIITYNPMWNVGIREMLPNNKWDSDSDMVRISLLITILNVAGKNINKEKLREMLNYVQIYILSKSYLSLEMENRIIECFNNISEEIEVHNDFFEVLRQVNLFDDVNR